MVTGTIIGASIFVQPSEIARQLDSPQAIMSAWIACGVLTLFGAFVCAELASAFPQTGGVYVFLRQAFSPLESLTCAWNAFVLPRNTWLPKRSTPVSTCVASNRP